MTLQTALTTANIATDAQIEEALARQQLYGSDVITNLLELALFKENIAHQALAAYHKLQVGPCGELPYASSAALEMVARDVAQQLALYPFKFHDNVLTVVASTALSSDDIALLALSSDIRVEVIFALPPRVRQALARDYAFALDKRTASAVEKLTYGETTDPTKPPPAVGDTRSFSQMPRPRSAPPFGFPDQWSDAATPTGSALLAETARQPTVAAHHLYEDGLPPRSSRELLYDSRALARTTHPPTSRHRGPYTLSQVRQDLENISNPDEVLEVYFNFAAQFFDYTALLSIQSKSARIRATRGNGTAIDEITTQLLPMSDNPILRQVRDDGQWNFCPLVSVQPGLASLLGREQESSALLLPIKVRSRVLLILVGAQDSTAVAINELGDLLAAEPFVAQAFERAIQLRKAASSPVAGGSQASPPRARLRTRDIAVRAQALVGALLSEEPAD